MAEALQPGSRIAMALDSLRDALSAEIDNMRSAGSSETISALNNAVRRLRQAESREEWIRTLTEAASAHCERAAFFLITQRGLSVDGSEFPLTASPAIAGVVESRDTVIAAATLSELSEPVALAIGEARRVWLAPVLVHEKVVGVLCAVPREGSSDVSAIELLASLASASVVTAPETTVESKPSELIRIGGLPEAPSANPPATRPSWNDLAKSEQAVHLKAQRFARSSVAQILLSKPEAIQRGRASSNLYATLKEEIDEGRDAFRRQFFESSPSMVDYLHLEIVRTLAQDDSRALGPDYPGPLP